MCNNARVWAWLIVCTRWPTPWSLFSSYDLWIVAVGKFIEMLWATWNSVQICKKSAGKLSYSLVCMYVVYRNMCVVFNDTESSFVSCPNIFMLSVMYPPATAALGSLAHPLDLDKRSCPHLSSHAVLWLIAITASMDTIDTLMFHRRRGKLKSLL